MSLDQLINVSPDYLPYVAYFLTVNAAIFGIKAWLTVYLSNSPNVKNYHIGWKGIQVNKTEQKKKGKRKQKNKLSQDKEAKLKKVGA